MDEARAALTTVDPLLEQPCFAVNVQVVPDATIRRQLAEIQELALRGLNLGVFRAPLESLHLSVFPLIWVRGTYEREPRDLWDAVARSGLRGVVQACDGIRPFDLRFSKLVATESAVILTAQEPPELLSLKTALEAWGLSQRIPVFRPRLVHVTLFRYRQAALLDHVRRSLQHVDIEPVHWKVTCVSVREEVVYPSLAWTELLTIDLSAPE